MNVLTDTWRGLVQRRLWPVALLLLAAAAAVPFLLASEEEPVLPNKPIAAAPEAGDTAATPIVAVASSAQREVGRDVVGSRKDPFRPAVAARKAKAPKTTTSSSGAAQPQPEPSSGGSTGSAGPAVPVTPTTPTTPTTGVTPVKKYEIATIAVRFGDSSGGQRPLMNLRRLKALPSVADPVLIYLGLRKDSKTAVFMVDAGSVVQGDGDCLPSPQNCQTVELQAGETEFIDVETDGKSAQYQLDFVKVRRKRTVSAEAARRAYSATAPGGRAVLRDRWNLLGRWRYDYESGRVRKIGKKAHAAAAARYQRRLAEAAAAQAG